MAKNPYVSVIVPMYNVEKYIKLCINSILGQTFQDFEIIIVDDASPDNCYEMVSELYGDNEKVRILRHRKNRGLGVARNTGIDNARGEYVYFVDSDDLISSNALEKLCMAAKSTGADVVHMSGWYDMQEDAAEPNNINKATFNLHQEAHNQFGFLEDNLDARLTYHLQNRIVVMSWLSMCKRNFLKRNKIKFLPIISEDEVFSVEILYRAKKYYRIPDALYLYRKHENSIMTTGNVNKVAKGIEQMLLGAKHLHEVMNRGGASLVNETMQTNVIYNFFERALHHHVRPFYSETISVELDSVVDKALSPTFGQYTTFVQYLFHNCNNIRHSHEKLNRQVQVLQQQLQQYQAKNSLMSQQLSMLKLVDKVKNVVDRAQNIPKRIFLMGTPQHGNLGDQAIVMGERYIISRCFPEYEIIEIPYDYSSGVLWELLTGLGFKRYVKETDIILLQGGGNLGNLWVNEKQVRRFIIQNFPNNKIIIFPQSIYFTNDAEGQKQIQESSRVYNSHNDLHLMLRDENSFDVAKKIFPQIHTYLLPDSVTALYGILDNVNDPREGVLFVLRKDKEKILNDAIIQQLQKYLAEKNIPFNVIDTVIADRVTEENRNDKVIDVIKKFRRSKLVITDRFHGVIFSVITKTPVIAFKSFDTKISSGIKWFKDIPAVFYTEGKTWAEVYKFINQACDGDIDSAIINDYAQLFVDKLNQIIF